MKCMSRLIENDYAQNALCIHVDEADKWSIFTQVKYLGIVLCPVCKQYVTTIPVSIISMYFFL